MVRNKKLFLVALKYRKEGKSYSEIRKNLGISKSTLSSWFSKRIWSKSIERNLNKKYKEKNTTRLVLMNKQKSLKKMQRYDEYKQKAQIEYKELKKSQLFISGLSLYWGEGEKTENGRVSVINTDPDMVQVVVRFYRKILQIQEHQLRAAIFLYKDIDQSKALAYWSEKTNIPREQFIKTQLLPSRSTLTKRKITNGICNVYFSSTELNIKIKEWIRLLANEMRV